MFDSWAIGRLETAQSLESLPVHQKRGVAETVLKGAEFRARSEREITQKTVPLRSGKAIAAKLQRHARDYIGIGPECCCDDGAQEFGHENDHFFVDEKKILALRLGCRSVSRGALITRGSGQDAHCNPLWSRIQNCPRQI